jgi:hypothetical protein
MDKLHLNTWKGSANRSNCSKMKYLGNTNEEHSQTLVREVWYRLKVAHRGEGGTYNGSMLSNNMWAKPDTV